MLRCRWATHTAHSLAQHAQDPDLVASSWLRTGAPIGIGCDIPTAGIFPKADVHDHRHGEDCWPTVEWTALHGFANYASAVEHADKVEATGGNKNCISIFCC